MRNAEISTIEKNLKSRRKAELRFQTYGLVALALVGIFLIYILSSIIFKGYSGFSTTVISIDVTLNSAIIDPDNTLDMEEIAYADFKSVARAALQKSLAEQIELPTNRVAKRALNRSLNDLLSSEAGDQIHNALKNDINLLDKTISMQLVASSNLDVYFKGNKDDALSGITKKYADALIKSGKVTTVFNKAFFSNADSREPEKAGILGSLIGSLMLVFCCLLLALPLGVITAIYLEEFAPRNRFTEIIELNISNLAAVPSIIFGLLGLSIYILQFGMPRSSAVVGGMTLALMILPIIIISTRAALNAVPHSIREGALALGASPLQAVLHHVLPLATPGIMTGTILGVARALGETAPLLMIGMVAFIASVPDGFTSSATAMPVQIFLWSDSSEAGFIEKTSAAIIILLLLLAVMNSLAIYIRNKFDRRW
jgi:phosphate transport system permease protein